MATQLERLAEITGDADGWEVTEPDEGYWYRGFRFTGDYPSWTVEGLGGEWVVSFEQGWYEQRGDARDFDEVIRLMRAMLAADAAFEASLREQDSDR